MYRIHTLYGIRGPIQRVTSGIVTVSLRLIAGWHRPENTHKKVSLTFHHASNFLSEGPHPYYRANIHPPPPITGILPTQFLPPATKLRHGNVFTPVCHSVHRGVSATPTPGRHPPLCSACWDMVNKRAVCILLECYLVLQFGITLITTRKRSCWKVIFLRHLSVHGGRG